MNKQLKPKIGNTLIPSFLYDIGVTYHDYGIVKTTKGTRQLYDYYKIDKITHDQKGLILDKIPLAVFWNGSNEYTPEKSDLYILIPKAEYYRQLNDQNIKRIL